MKQTCSLLLQTFYSSEAQKNCNISINSSGPSLHKRGYRSNQFHAPINEVLAAGVIMLSNWSYKEKLIDPMCGSGTLLIELIFCICIKEALTWNDA